MLAAWSRYLFFRASGEDMRALSWRRFLPPALLATWIVGMGRYWDSPSAHLLQRLGAGSLVYVFALGALLWIVIAPLRPARWSYLQTVTFVALTSPPALIYALPVERWMPLDSAMFVNLWFLAVVASWRVALLVYTVRRFAELSWPRTVVGCLLPLCAIVSTLATLNLEKAVLTAMAGNQHGPPPTANDAAYLHVFLLGLLSQCAAVPLLIAYVVLLRAAWKERSKERRARTQADRAGG